MREHRVATEATEARPHVGPVRYVIATLWLAACLYIAWALALGLGTYYMTEAGLDRLREKAFFVVVAGGVGVYGMGGFLLLTRRHMLSPWLALGLAPAAVVALHHLGVIQ